MGISETCIRRPVLTTLITASMIVFGIFAYRLLAVAALPTVDYPTIAITATLPGGGKIDLGAPGVLRSGSLAAEIEMRDQTLPQAQRQLDDLAAGVLAASLEARPRDICRPPGVVLAPAGLLADATLAADSCRAA